jgi:hypothetical protein
MVQWLWISLAYSKGQVNLHSKRFTGFDPKLRHNFSTQIVQKGVDQDLNRFVKRYHQVSNSKSLDEIFYKIIYGGRYKHWAE